MALNYRCYPPSSSSSSLPTTFSCHSHLPSFSHQFGTVSSRSRTSLSISATSSPNPNPNPPSIFLTSLLNHEIQLQQQQQQHEHEHEQIQNPQTLQTDDEPQQEEQDEEEPEFHSIDDPILDFFKSRSSSQHPVSNPDPPRLSKFSLNNNRRPTWHLSPTINSTPEEQDETPLPIFQTEPINNPQSPIGGTIGTILDLARNLPKNSTLGELLGSYQGKLDKGECIQVLDLMGKEGLAMGCLQFFEWMSFQQPSLVTPWAYRILFPVLGKASMGDKVMVLFRNIPKVKLYRDVYVYNAALSSLLCCRRYDDAWKVYEELETNNVQPNHWTCSIMITIMRKRGNSAKDAWDFFEKMNRKGVKCSVEVMGSLIKAFCDEGLKKEALIIQVDMEKKGISSHAIIYNTLMDAFSKSGQVEEAEGLFAEMKAKGIAPTTASFNILMDAYSRRMQPEIIESLMQEMENMGLEPNVKSFTCLISGYGRMRKMSDMAANAFLKMKKVGIKPTSHSYTALIHAYAVDGWHEKAYITFENMQREKIKPSVETYTALLDAFRRAGDTETLMKIWKMMIIDKVEGTRVTFNILVDGFAKQGQFVEARDVISEFGKIGFQPTLMTYNMLMNAYGRGAQVGKLPQLLKEMAALKIKPDSITYSTMIYAYVRVRDFKRAFFLS